MKSIKISQWDGLISDGKGTILDRALRQGVPYPHNCRSGECGQCKSQLIRGNVQQLPCLDTALSDEDRKSDLILACRSIATSDVEIAWIGSESSNINDVREYTVEVRMLERVGRVILLSLTQVDGESPLQFRSGQYVDFSLPGCPPRPYSMGSISGSDIIDFHIEHRNGGWVSSYVANKLMLGDRFTLTGPYGDAYYRSDEEGPLVAFGSGTGMAPILSIVKTSLIESPQRPVSLIYAERISHDQYLSDVLQNLSDNYPELTVSQLITRGDSSKSSKLHEQISNHLIKLPYTLKTASVYIAGSPSAVETVARAVRLLGTPSSRIRADAFTRSSNLQTGRTSIVARFGRMFSRVRR